jgi:hypothetical protein
MQRLFILDRLMFEAELSDGIELITFVTMYNVVHTFN